MNADRQALIAFCGRHAAGYSGQKANSQQPKANNRFAGKEKLNRL
jgi:hypothetical protein